MVSVFSLIYHSQFKLPTKQLKHNPNPKPLSIHQQHETFCELKIYNETQKRKHKLSSMLRLKVKNCRKIFSRTLKLTAQRKKNFLLVPAWQSWEITKNIRKSQNFFNWSHNISTYLHSIKGPKYSGSWRFRLRFNFDFRNNLRGAKTFFSFFFSEASRLRFSFLLSLASMLTCFFAFGSRFGVADLDDVPPAFSSLIFLKIGKILDSKLHRQSYKNLFTTRSTRHAIIFSSSFYLFEGMSSRHRQLLVKFSRENFFCLFWLFTSGKLKVFVECCFVTFSRSCRVVIRRRLRQLKFETYPTGLLDFIVAFDGAFSSFGSGTFFSQSPTFSISLPSFCCSTSASRLFQKSPSFIFKSTALESPQRNESFLSSHQAWTIGNTSRINWSQFWIFQKNKNFYINKLHFTCSAVCWCRSLFGCKLSTSDITNTPSSTMLRV